MKKDISIALIAMLVVAMAGCSQSQPAPTAAPFLKCRCYSTGIGRWL